jgi:hypothetical protein
MREAGSLIDVICNKIKLLVKKKKEKKGAKFLINFENINGKFADV